MVTAAGRWVEDSEEALVKLADPVENVPDDPATLGGAPRADAGRMDLPRLALCGMSTLRGAPSAQAIAFACRLVSLPMAAWTAGDGSLMAATVADDAPPLTECTDTGLHGLLTVALRDSCCCWAMLAMPDAPPTGLGTCTESMRARSETDCWYWSSVLVASRGLSQGAGPVVDAPPDRTAEAEIDGTRAPRAAVGSLLPVPRFGGRTGGGGMYVLQFKQLAECAVGLGREQGRRSSEDVRQWRKRASVLCSAGKRRRIRRRVGHLSLQPRLSIFPNFP